MTTTAISMKILKMNTCDFVTILKLSYRTTRCVTLAKYVTKRDHRLSSYGEFMFAMLSKVNKIYILPSAARNRLCTFSTINVVTFNNPAARSTRLHRAARAIMFHVQHD